MFNSYTKIETPYKRDMEGTKKLIEGKFRIEEIEYLKNHIWICTEKINGTNIGIVWDGHKVSFQGRTERAQIPNQLVNKLMEMFGGDVNEELNTVCSLTGNSFDDILWQIENDTDAEVLDGTEEYFSESEDELEYYDDYWTDTEAERFSK